MDAKNNALSTFPESDGLWRLVDINKNSSGRFLAEHLEKAGVTINGNNSCDIKIYDENVINRVLAQGNLGLGEAYMDGQWDSAALDQFFCKILAARLDKKARTFKAYLSWS